jgi:hypothetical protein
MNAKYQSNLFENTKPELVALAAMMTEARRAIRSKENQIAPKQINDYVQRLFRKVRVLKRAKVTDQVINYLFRFEEFGDGVSVEKLRLYKLYAQGKRDEANEINFAAFRNISKSRKVTERSGLTSGYNGFRKRAEQVFGIKLEQLPDEIDRRIKLKQKEEST